MAEQSDTYEYLKGQGFLSIDRESYPLFKSYEDERILLQERSAMIVTAWSGAHRGLYKIIHGYLCGVFFFDIKPVYFTIYPPPPRGIPGCPLQRIIDILYGLSREAGLPFLPIENIAEASLHEYEGISAYDIKTNYMGNDNEYAYKIVDLLELSGEVNYYKRKRLKKFLDKEQFSLIPMTRENVSLCVEIEAAWCHFQDCAECESYYGCEKKALENMIGIFDEQVHTGLIGYDDGRPAGYIIGEKISGKVAFLYFGKGIKQDYFIYLIYMLFKEHISGVEYMNINDDMGNLGLRLFKNKLSAHELWRRYSCAFTKTGNGVSG